MKKYGLILISTCTMFYFFYVADNMHHLKQLPWDSSASWQTNALPYILFFVSAFASWSVIGLFFTLKSNSKGKNHTKEIIGTLLNIEYSSIRVNNSPRFKATVEYEGVQGEFDALGEEIQFHLKIGDQVVIFADPNNLKDAFFDIEASIARKNSSPSPFHADYNAMFKITEITPNFEHGPDTFILSGEVFPNSGDEPYQAKFQQVLDQNTASNIPLGKLVKCLVEGEEKKTISLQL